MFQSDLLGYSLHGKPYPHAPGCSQLDAVLRGTPSGRHFDPEKIHLTTANPAGDVQRVTITTQARGPETMRVCAGRVALEDRMEKRVQFLTLGGSLSIDFQDGVSLCRLSSPAPIFGLSLTRGAPQLLAEEIEEILAHRRARWETHRREFDRRLASVEPGMLYMACLVELQQKFRTIPTRLLDSDIVRLVYFLDAEIEVLLSGAGRVVTAPALEDIL